MEVLESWMVERLKIGKFHFDACGLMEVVWGWYRPSAFVMTHVTTSLHLSSLARIEPTQTYAPWWICWVVSNCFNMFQTLDIYIYSIYVRIYLRAAAPAADPGKRGKEERAWATFPIYIYIYVCVCVCECVCVCQMVVCSSERSTFAGLRWT